MLYIFFLTRINNTNIAVVSFQSDSHFKFIPFFALEYLSQWYVNVIPFFTSAYYCPVSYHIVGTDGLSAEQYSQQWDQSPRMDTKYGRNGKDKSAAVHSTRHIRINRPSSKKSTVASPITFSNQLGYLYRRRASNASKKIPVLSLPQRKLAPEFYDVEPPTPEMEFGKFNIFKTSSNIRISSLSWSNNSPLMISFLFTPSPDFHRLANSHFTAMILAQAEAQSPESS